MRVQTICFALDRLARLCGRVVRVTPLPAVTALVWADLDRYSRS